MAQGHDLGRIRKALREERFQHAVQLVKQLYRDEPTPENQQLLHEAYLGRIRQLRQQGQLDDARAMLDHVSNRVDAVQPGWLEQIARELAACGAVGRALELADGLGDPQVKAKVLNLAADWAIQHQPAGKSSLPEALHGQFDTIIQGFALLAAGRDEAVRELLQNIGLQSPFLEWKLLLRGLQAVYQKDQARALENWDRLSPERGPARLAAPLRLRIDPAFRAAQKPEVQAALERQADRLQGNSLVQSLRGLQQAFSTEDLPLAFRIAAGMVLEMRRQTPELLPRLARCFQWAILDFGDQPDLARFKRLFGAPADDPELARLEALALERRDDLEGAHHFWQRYDQAVAAHAHRCPTGQSTQVRALIWQRLGQNAAKIPDREQLKCLPAFFRDMPAPAALDPSAEKCFERSLQLDPDQLSTYQELLKLYERRGKPAKVEQTARRLLERFPEHVPTLKLLAQRWVEKKALADAIEFYQRALRANPLDCSLRAALAGTHLLQARVFAEQQRFALARQAYQAALELDDGHGRRSTYCQWAACEFKAEQPEQAEQRLRQAQAGGSHPLAVAYPMLVEAIRLKLAKAFKQRFAAEFAAALAGPHVAGAGVDVLQSAAAYRSTAVKYHGQGAHEKKLLAYLERVPPADFSEQELVQAADALVALAMPKEVRKFASLGQQRFPRNPHFLWREAESYCRPRLKAGNYHRVLGLLHKAERLARQLPADQQKGPLEEIEKCRLEIRTKVSPLDMMPPMWAGIPGNPFEIDDMDDWDDDP